MMLNASFYNKLLSIQVKRTEQNRILRIMQQSTIIASALIPIINITGLGFTDIQTRFTSSIIGAIIAVITVNTIRKISRELQQQQCSKYRSKNNRVANYNKIYFYYLFS